MSAPSLAHYFRDAFDRGVIDHAVRAHVHLDGLVTFYIHPANVDGDTLDLEVKACGLCGADVLRPNPLVGRLS